MIRLLMQLFGKPYEPCKTCEVLREQLAYERAQNNEMLATLTSLLKPQIITHEVNPPKPITPRFTMFSRRRAELERVDRENARIKATSPVVAKADDEVKKDELPKRQTVEQLEMELGVAEGGEN